MSSALHLPTWSGIVSGGNASRSTLQRTQGRTYRRAIAGEGALIPGGYGRFRTPARVTIARRSGNFLLLCCVWCEGPADAIESVRLGGEPYGGASAHYTGTPTQLPDAWLSAAIEGYTDALPGICYSVLRVPANADVSRQIEAQVRGFRVWDPRVQAAVWSDNPALCLAHFIVLRTGRAVDWSSVADAADACDELLEGGERRRTLGLLLDTPARIEDWIETLREYAGCYIVWDDLVRLVPDRPRAVDHVIGPDKIVSISLGKRSLDDVPNRVVVEHTKITGDTWTTGRAATDYPVGQQLREQRVRLLGIQDYAPSLRQAEERHKRYQLADLYGELVLTDEALEITAGDVLSVTHNIGLTNKEFRVILDPVAIDRGRWRVPVEEYAAGIYSNSVATEPSTPDTGLPDPRAVPAVSAPVLAEEVYQLQNGDYATRIRATWVEVDYPYAHQYHIEVRDSAETLVWGAETRSVAYVTGAVQELETYTVSVAAVGFAGTVGAAGSAAIVAQGKLLPPGDVPQIVAAQVAADAVRAQWEPAIDVDIYRYELRRGAEGATSVPWESAVIVDEVDGLTTRIDDLPLGTYELLVRALDSVRQYSPGVTRVSVTLLGPVAPASLTAFEVGGELRLSWPLPVGYIAAYEIRYGDTGGNWETATLLDRVQALRYTSRDVPAGTWRIYIRAVDTAGNLSTGITTAEVTVTLDSASFLAASITWSNPSLTNMASWAHRPQNYSPVHYVTETGETAASKWPSAMDTYTDPLSTYHATAPTEWLTESVDLGALVSGTWQLSGGWDAISGAVDAQIELSDDDVAWDVYTQLSVQASGRYARVRLSAAGTSTLHVRDSQVVLRLDAVAREESGEITSSASGPVTVTLSRNYSAVQEITLTPQGSTALIATFDNVQLPDEFDVYVFDVGGSQVAAPCRWKFKGV